IKGIYSLDGDELRLCLAPMDKDRPEAFPEKPGPGEVLILHRATSGASPAKAEEKQPAKTDQERLVGGWVIVNDDSMRKGEPWIISMDEITMQANVAGVRGFSNFPRLDPAKSPKQIDIRVTKTNLEAVGEIKGIYSLDNDGELRLCLGEMGKDRPAAFPEKPKPGEVLILHGPP